RITTPADLMPFVDPDALEYFGAAVPTPTRRPSSPSETPVPERFAHGAEQAAPSAYRRLLREVVAGQPRTTLKGPRFLHASGGAARDASTLPEYVPQPQARPEDVPIPRRRPESLDPIDPRSIRGGSSSDSYDAGRLRDEPATADPFAALVRGAGSARVFGALL